MICKNLIRIAVLLVSFNAFASKENVQGVISCTDKDGNSSQVKAEMAEYMILLAQGKTTSTEYIALLGKQLFDSKICEFTPIK
jgi:hypothetical protein